MTSENCSDYQDWELLALGVLEGDEQRDMEAHLADGCDGCRSSYLSAQAVVAGLAVLAPDIPLNPDGEKNLKRRLMGGSSIQINTAYMPAQKRTPPRVAAWWMAAACMVAVVALGISRIRIAHELSGLRLQVQSLQQELRVPKADDFQNASAQKAALEAGVQELHAQAQLAIEQRSAAERKLRTIGAELLEAQQRNHDLDARLAADDASRAQTESQLTALQQQVAQLQAEKGSLTQVAAEHDHITSLLNVGSLSKLDLKPVGDQRAAARVYWHNDRGLLLVARDLPQLPEHASFELWFYRQGSPDLVRVGTLQVRRGGDASLFVPPGPALEAMSGALLTMQTGDSGVSPGVELLRVKP